jgi:hypothetical protein
MAQQAWRANNALRHVWIFETLKAAFTIGPGTKRWPLEFDWLFDHGIDSRKFWTHHDRQQAARHDRLTGRLEAHLELSHYLELDTL